PHLLVHLGAHRAGSIDVRYRRQSRSSPPIGSAGQAHPNHCLWSLGLFAALAGLVMAGRLSSAQPQAGVGYELDAIAAVVIGGASLAGGQGRATGTLVGALLLAVIRNGLNLL